MADFGSKNRAFFLPKNDPGPFGKVNKATPPILEPRSRVEAGVGEGCRLGDADGITPESTPLSQATTPYPLSVFGHPPPYFWVGEFKKQALAPERRSRRGKQPEFGAFQHNLPQP